MAQQNEVLSAKLKELIDEVEDMRKRNRHLGEDAKRRKQKKKLLNQVLAEAEEGLTWLHLEAKCLEQDRVEA